MPRNFSLLQPLAYHVEFLHLLYLPELVVCLEDDYFRDSVEGTIRDLSEVFDNIVIVYSLSNVTIPA